MALWQACERVGEYGQLLQLLLATGQRRSDVAEAPWREFDFKRKLWTISPERFKSDVPHIVPLSQLALDIIDKLSGEGECLFHITGFSREKEKIDRLMLGIMRKLDPGATLPRWTVHDLRRTVRTRLSEKALKVPYEVREAVIGHTKKGLDRVYDQYDFLDEKREALDAWVNRPGFVGGSRS